MSDSFINSPFFVVLPGKSSICWPCEKKNFRQIKFSRVYPSKEPF
jgi:hypothetical protein